MESPLGIVSTALLLTLTHKYLLFHFPLPLTVLDADEQQHVTQLLIYLLPACNSDTLHRLLEFLSTVTDHAHDKLDKDGQEVGPLL